MQQPLNTALSEALAARSAYWDSWNQIWRTPDRFDHLMERQRDAASSAAKRLRLQDAAILDLGCGTGWLGASLIPYGRVTGCDLSAAALVQAQARHPAVTFVHGDFLQCALPGPFDLIVSADAFSHFPDHAAAIARVAELLRPAGAFVLMTQNPMVWKRRSRLSRMPNSVDHPEPEQWPSWRRLQALFAPHFRIEHFSTFDPGGDRGFLWWVENRYVRGAMSRVVGPARWRRLLERARLGREFIIEAIRK